MKLGVIEDEANRTKLAKLLIYNSAKHFDTKIDFDTYVSEMKEGQSQIYYIGGENKNILREQPALQMVYKKGFDVLILDEAIDEFTMSHLNEYKDHKL